MTLNWMTSSEYERWFTYQEVLNALNGGIAPLSPYLPLSQDNWFTLLMASNNIQLHYDELSSDISSSTITDIVNYLMTNVYNRWYSYYLYHIDTEEDRQLTNTEARKAMFILLNVLENTYSKYIPLFEANKKGTADVLSKPSSKAITKYRNNDTPQNFGDYNTSDYSTNATYSESSVSADEGTLVTRLNEAFKNFHSITLEWSNEFKNVFLSEDMI